VFSHDPARNVQGDPGADAALPSYLQHTSGRPLLPHAGGIPAGTMVQQGRTRGRTQHDGFHTILIRSDDLRRQEPGADGDANASLLVVAAVPVLEGSGGCLRGMGEEDSGLVCGAPGTAGS